MAVTAGAGGVRTAAAAATLCVTREDAVAELLRSPDFAAVDVGAGYERLAREAGQDFPAIRRLVGRFPTFLEGEAHKETRAAMAAMFAARRGRQAAAVRRAAGEAAGRLADGRTVEVTEEMVRPVYQALSRELLDEGEDEALFLDAGFMAVVNPTLSLSRRRAIDARIAEVLASARGTAVPADLKLALLTVGREPFIGSMSLSIRRMAERNPGMRLSDMAWPERMPATGLPFVERVALRDWEGFGLRIGRGRRVRLFLEPEDASTGQELLFGRGRHLCLGRQLSELAWSAFRETLSRVPLRAEPLALEMRPSDPFFLYPTRNELRLHG